jgi:hypothetical protein
VNRLAPEAAHVVFYESIVEDPEGELDRLGRFLARYSAGGWTLAPERPSAVDLPSRANYRGTPVLAADERLQAWQREVPEKDVSGALEILAVFGLDRIYGPDIRPLVRPDEVLLGSPPTSGTGRRSDGAAASTGS